jgi:hypothetical protein
MAWTGALQLTDDKMPQITTKQFGDAGEYWVAAKLTFAGLPTIKLSDNWPGYDLLALPPNQAPLKISVKTRRQATVKGNVKFTTGEWDWLAIVLFPLEGKEPCLWLLPRAVAFAHSVPLSAISDQKGRRVRYETLFGSLSCYRDNLRLDPNPAADRLAA